DLFIAGFLPGMLMLVALSVYSALNTPKIDKPAQTFDLKEALSAIKDSAWEIPLPIVVLGGIYGGYFAVSEAAALTALYVLIVSVIIRKEISLRKLPSVMRDSMKLVGAILLIL